MANNVYISISDIGPASNNKRTAKYGKGGGTPNWAGVASNGDIDLNKNGNGQPDVDLKFSLPTGFLFNATNPFTISPDTGMFSVISGSGTANLVVNDGNNDTEQTPYQYTLILNDGTKLDPKVINH